MAYKGRSGKNRPRGSWQIPTLILLALLLLPLPQRAFAKTYVITDGDQTVTYTTFATDPAEVLSQAGLTLDPEDSYTTGGDTITVRRAGDVILWYHGEKLQVTSGGETVAQLLTRLSLDVEPEAFD